MRISFPSCCEWVLRFGLFILMLVGTGRSGRAQTAAAALSHNQEAKMTQCYRVIKGDSVALYYNDRYSLTPVECATIRRYARMTEKADFKGEVRDYNTADNGLRYRLHYQQSLRHGRYESYFPNGRLAVRGDFAQGQPTGVWEFWYANGRPHQTLEWTSQLSPRLRILAYWDSTGQQGVANGNGAWHGVMPLVPRRYGGPVVDGLAQGVWESRDVTSNKLLTTEVYDKGQFREGKALDFGTQRYKDRPLLEPQLSDPTLSAEQFSLGFNCETLAEMRQRGQLIIKARTEPPYPPGEPNAYLDQLLSHLLALNSAAQQLPRADGHSVMVTATVDAEGRLHDFVSEAPALVFGFASFSNSLGRWRPATANGHPVPGKVVLTVQMLSTRLTSRIQTAVVYPLPVDVLEKKPK